MDALKRQNEKSERDLSGIVELVEILPEPGIIIDSSGTIVCANSLCEELFGYTSNELQGNAVELLIPDRFKDQHRKNREQFNKHPRRQIMGKDKDILGLHKTGKQIPVEIKLTPYTLEKTDFVLALIVDVTERYVARASLRGNEERLGVLLESTNAIPWEADPVSWKFTYVGPQAVELLGYPIEQWYEKDFWVNSIHPDDREAAIRTCAELSKTRSNFEFEYRMFASNGDIIWLKDIVNVEFNEGKSSVLRGFLIDITIHKQDEQKLREQIQFSDAIIASLPCMFFMLDRKGRYVRFNKNTEKILGCSRDELAGQSAVDFVSPEDRREIKQRIEAGFLEGFYTAEHENITKDGYKANYATYGTKASIGGEDYLVGIEIDISEQKKAGKDTARLSNQLAHVNRLGSMGELTASIAHELNQPLTAILSNAQAALRFMEKDDIDLDGVREIFEDIVADDKRAGELMHHIRSLVKRDDSKFEQLDINNVIEKVCSFIHHDLDMKRIRLSTELTPNIPMLLGDPIQLQQVIINLFINASHAMQKLEWRERLITISTHELGDGQVEIVVIDTGHGIDEELQEKIFQPFYTTKQEGMGMGLAINRTIIESHGGRMWVENRPGQGAAFYISLPLIKEGL